MRVLLKAYTQLNVGDDLFIDIITRRYPDARFMLASETRGYGAFAAERENLGLFCGHTFFYRALRRLGRTPFIEKSIMRRFDAVVYIGGSVFMENAADRYLENVIDAETAYCAKKNIPYYILSCNFGPYETEEYAARMRKCFARCTQVCFRDSASYRMFSELGSVSLAPDAAFSVGLKKPHARPDVLGVAPISYKNRKGGAELDGAYIKNTADIIRAHLEGGGHAEIFCFCAFEGDTDAADEILSELGARASDVRVRVYDGRLYEFLREYLSCGRVFASRFHAVLLALVYEIPLMAHIYSKKTENVLRDAGVWNDMDFDSFKQYRINAEYIKNAQKIWEKLDRL